MKKLLALIISLALFIFLFQLVMETPSKLLSERVSSRYVQKNVLSSGEAEETSANLVTSVVLSYRGLDTLGEVTVLFAAATGVAFFMKNVKERLNFLFSSFIVQTGARVVSPLLVTLGIYIFIHGHLTPGGGFQGGTTIAITTLLLYVAGGLVERKRTVFRTLEGLSGSVYVLIGLMGLAVGGAFLYNFLPLGKIGELFSSGIVPVIYVLIGIKVGSELSNLVLHTTGGDNS
ncbi:MAG TPA: cation:proton antiporter [Thermotogae bacterium]|nr:multicomponent Na+:H+ antiporter subunit [Thermotogota bacterium]HCZ07213.1 cation:proton antiporter [Thermotogota bacterium]